MDRPIPEFDYFLQRKFEYVLLFCLPVPQLRHASFGLDCCDFNQLHINEIFNLLTQQGFQLRWHPVSCAANRKVIHVVLTSWISNPIFQIRSNSLMEMSK